MSDIILSRATPSESAEKFCQLVPNLIHFDQQWLMWNGTAYLEVLPDDMEQKAHHFLRDAKMVRLIEYLDANSEPKTRYETVPFNPKNADVKELLHALRNVVHLQERLQPPCWLDGRTDLDPTRLIACRNGLLDIDTRILYEHTPQFFTRTALPIDYDAEAPVPQRFVRFLNEVQANHPECIPALQQMIGYLLSGDNRHQLIFFLHGDAGSGKSTFLKVARALIGENNISGQNIMLLAENYGEYRCVGKSVCIIADLLHRSGTDLVHAASKMNQISGGDLITARMMFTTTPWTGVLPTRFVIAGNSVPDFGIHSSATARRLRMFSFDKSFVDCADEGLIGKLLCELPGILNWALDGLDELEMVGKFPKLAAMDDLKDRMLHISNPIRGFVSECVEIEAGASATKADVYAQYVSFCTQHGVRPLGREKFAEGLFEIEPTVRPTKRQSDKVRVPVFEGLRLVSAHVANEFGDDALRLEQPADIDDETWQRIAASENLAALVDAVEIAQLVS